MSSTKVTLAVPDELYEKMKLYGNKPTGGSVNWSKMFQDAVERFLEIEKRTKDIDIPTTVLHQTIENLITEGIIDSIKCGRNVFTEWNIK